MKIYLIGMPFSGKTTIGKYLAEKMNFTHLDTDEMITIEEKTSISDLFAIKGENYFRKLEKTTLEKIKKHNNIVVSTGGGVVLDRENRFIMEGIIIFLDVSLDNLEKRSQNDQTRPLLMKKSLEELYLERRKFYYFFNTFIVDGNGEVNEVVDKIVNLLKKEDLL